jgi:predicted cupin superfamily sugar epimerase
VLTAAEVIEYLALEPLPAEGGMWAQTWRDEYSSAIYYLLRPGDFSALHRVTGPEICHFYAGSPAVVLLLHPDKLTQEVVLGADLAAGQRPLLAVPGGVWQGSYTLGEWTLLGTTMAPAFRPEDFELAGRDVLIAAYPAAEDRIRMLTREPPSLSDR